MIDSYLASLFFFFSVLIASVMLIAYYTKKFKNKPRMMSVDDVAQFQKDARFVFFLVIVMALSLLGTISVTYISLMDYFSQWHVI